MYAFPVRVRVGTHTQSETWVSCAMNLCFTWFCAHKVVRPPRLQEEQSPPPPLSCTFKFCINWLYYTLCLFCLGVHFFPWCQGHASTAEPCFLPALRMYNGKWFFFCRLYMTARFTCLLHCCFSVPIWSYLCTVLFYLFVTVCLK